MTKPAQVPLRLPQSLKAAAEVIAQREGISLNQFIMLALAEKVSALGTASFFAEHQKTADLMTFRNLLTRSAGELPREDDLIQ